MDLTQVMAHQPTVAELQAELAELKARFHKQQALRLKVSEKGGLSLYGLNVKFPVTLYLEQWERLLAFVPEIEKFIAANRSKFTTKADKQAAVAKKVN